jgi:hypothetical protein
MRAVSLGKGHHLIHAARANRIATALPRITVKG